jgi:hypothetical protein
MEVLKMREIITKLYTFDELSESAQRRAWMDHTENLGEFGWNSEYRATLSAFCKAFDVLQVEYDVNENAFNFEFALSFEPVWYMEPLRFARFVWNQYAHQIQRGRYYGKITGDGRHVFRHSNATMEYSCPFTGFVADMAIAGPVWDCIHYKKEYTCYDQLIEDCLTAFFEEWRNDMEYETSIECFEEYCTVNELEFTEDGEIWRN